MFGQSAAAELKDAHATRDGLIRSQTWRRRLLMQGIIFGSLHRRWMRTLLTGLSTLLAFTLLGFFLAVRHGVAVGPKEAGADLLLLEPAGEASPLPVGLLSTVSAFPGVRSAAGMNGKEMRFGADRHPLVVEGLSSKAFLEVSRVVVGGALSRTDARTWLADRTGALVSADAARKYGWRPGQTFILHTMPGALPRDLSFTVDGVLAKRKGITFTDAVNLHLGYFNRWAHTDTLDVVFIRVKQAKQADDIARDIELKFVNSATPLSVQSFKSLLQGMAERFADVNALGSIVMLASLFGLFLICFNAMIHSMSERVGEFALLKAIGFTQWRLLWLVLFEAFVAIVPAAAMGLACALIFIRLLTGTGFLLPGVTLTPLSFTLGVLIAVALATISSALPGLRVVHLNCAQALRRG